MELSVDRVLRDLGFRGDYRAYLDMTTPLREMYMAKIIGSHVDKGDIPLVAVVGAGHVMPDSKIHRNLESREIGYVTIVQQPQVLQGLREDANFFTTS